MKHVGLEHPGEPPDFYFKMVSSHRSALSRQVREAVRIRRRGGENMILNSRSEFNRCHIPRLTIQEEDMEDRKVREAREQEEMATMSAKNMIRTPTLALENNPSIKEVIYRVDFLTGPPKK